MRATTLQQNVLVASLSPALQLRVWAWVGRRCMPRNPELVRALAACAGACPTALRVKELLESVEAYAVAEAFISGCAVRGHPTHTIAEVACGHGMVGVLLAYRFPHSTVPDISLYLPISPYISLYLAYRFPHSTVLCCDLALYLPISPYISLYLAGSLLRPRAPPRLRRAGGRLR